MLISELWIPIIAVSSLPVMVIGFPLARAFAKRMGESPVAHAIPSDVSARLERMEHAIDSIAIEVERISEGQRFTTKLLSERTSSAAIGTGAPAQTSRREP